MPNDPATSPRFSGIGGHHSHKAGTVEWLTPPEIIAALGPFDFDPCAPLIQPYPTAPLTFTIKDNGLTKPWPKKKRAFLNPPYANGEIEKWLARMAEHDFGTALIFARTETDAFFRYIWEQATALLFMRGRINFHVGVPFTDQKTGKRYEIGDRAPGNAGAPTVLCAYGATDAEILAGCKIEGQFVPLRIPRQFFVSLFPASNEVEKIDTWRALVADYFAAQDGPVSLDQLYRDFAPTAKAAGNPNFEAKLRQQVQAGPYVRVGRGLWDAPR